MAKRSMQAAVVVQDTVGKKPSAQEKNVLQVEKNYKAVVGIQDDLSIYPLRSKQVSNIATNKDKSKKHGEVFTPLWLVDGMINQARPKLGQITLDLCSGYGQFTIRHIRKRLSSSLANYRYNL